MWSSSCLLIALLVVGAHAQGSQSSPGGPQYHAPKNLTEELKLYKDTSAYNIVLAQLSAFAGAVKANDMDALFLLFNSTKEERKHMENVVAGFLKIYKMQPISASYTGENEIVANLIVNEKANMQWKMVRKAESPTGWAVKMVRIVADNNTRKMFPDLSDYIWCFADLLRCMGNTLALIFG